METNETEESVQQLLEAQLMELLDDPEVKNLSVPCVDLSEELGKAADIKKQAMRMVAIALEDARLGRHLTIRPIHEIAQRMMSSLLNNDDALLNFSLIKRRSDYLFQHSVNVGIFMMAMARSLGYGENVVVGAGVGGMMHDVGMVRIPENIYNKTSKLSDYELRQVQKHVELGYRLLVRTPGIPEVALVIAGTHHSRQDGSGYSLNTNLDAFSQFQPLSAIVDIYDAMTSPRPYRRAWAATSALKKIHDMSKKQQLDPILVHTFIHHIGIYPLGSLVRLENQLLGVVIQTNRSSLLHPVVRLVINGRDGKKIEPRDVDLLEWKDKAQGYVIIASEHPEDWGIDPVLFLPHSAVYS
ncbi:MAG: HD domain-containing protein [Nitrospirae bacterium]|nr:HD domain-containing protein [Magnetococcales bacterium]HAT51295.1 hypothetical protein [Alphaproteobacteria bacterium]